MRNQSNTQASFHCVRALIHHGVLWSETASAPLHAAGPLKTHTHTHTHTQPHTGCRLKYQKVSGQAKGETGVVVRQAGPLSSLSLTVCLCEIKDTAGNRKQGMVSVFDHAYCRCQMCLPIPLVDNHYSVSIIIKPNIQIRNYDGRDYMEKYLSLLLRVYFYQWNSFDYTYFEINDVRHELTANGLLINLWKCVNFSLKKIAINLPLILFGFFKQTACNN